MDQQPSFEDMLKRQIGGARTVMDQAPELTATGASFNPAPYAGMIKKNEQETRQKINEMDAIKAPTPPKLQDYPIAEKPEFHEPLDAFRSFAPVAAIFGSLLTRAPLKTAMASMAASIDAQHKGDIERNEAKRQEHKDAMDAAKAQNDLEMQKYDEIFNNVKWNVDRKQSELTNLASLHNDPMLLATLNEKGVESANQLINKRREAFEKSMEYSQKVMTQQKNKMNGTTLSEAAIEKYADAIAGGVKPSALGLGYGNSPNKAAVMDKFADKYPDVSLSDVEKGYSADIHEANTVGNAAGRIKLAANSLDQAIPLARDAMKKVDLSQFPDVNALENYARSHSGDPGITALNTAIQTVISDYSSLISRTGQQTDSTRAAARELVNTNMASGQMDAFFDQIQKEKDAQIRAIEETKKPGSTKDSAPKVGAIEDGHRFKGGNPADPSSWEKVQ